MSSRTFTANEIRENARRELKNTRKMSAAEQKSLFGHNVCGKLDIWFDEKRDEIVLTKSCGFGADFNSREISIDDFARLAANKVTLNGTMIECGDADSWIAAAKREAAKKANPAPKITTLVGRTVKARFGGDFKAATVVSENSVGVTVQLENGQRTFVPRSNFFLVA